jgi:peroxiredoxin
MTLTESTLWTRALRHTVTAVLIVLTALVIVLAKRLTALEQQARPGLRVGEVAAPFSARTSSGDLIEVDFSRRPTVLYYFSPTCSWCERNWENIRAIASTASAGFQVIAVSSQPVPEGFLRDRHLSIQVADSLDAEVSRRYRLGATPETLVIDTGGRVLKTWFGAYTGSQANDVSAFFGVRLPGLTPVRLR